MNIFQVIKKETQCFTGKTAVIDGDRKMSYGELICSAERIARSLKEKGIGPHCRVGLLCDNSIDYISSSLAILSLSAVIVPVSEDYPEQEINLILNDISVDFLIFRGRDCAGAQNLASDGLLGEDFFIKKIAAGAEVPGEYYQINPAFIRFSSGTTGKSKGVVLSHETIIERTEAADKGLRITPEDIIIWVLSMSFHFVVTILLFLRRAATIVLCNKPFPDSLVEGMTKYRGTLIYASPFHYDLLVNSDMIVPESVNNIRLAISTTMKLPENIADGFFTKFGIELAEAYGIIEVGMPFINLSPKKNTRSSVGRILPDYKIRIDNQDTNGVGKISIKGKGILDAYYSPWQNRKDVLVDGWFKTGDLGRIDESGFLTIVGRKNDVINFIGIKMFPSEVEDVINQHPLVKESLVYGEAHPRYGQLPVAKLVVKNGNNNTLNLQDLRRFCYTRLAQYKVPKEFIFVSQLPKTASGKIKR